MAAKKKKKIPVGTKRKLGPYKGSEQNGGRTFYVFETKMADGSWKHTSKNAARQDYEEEHGKLPRGTDVDHKDGNKKNAKKSNLQPMSHSKNVGKGNKERTKKKK